jgi:hypothetical protein
MKMLIEIYPFVLPDTVTSKNKSSNGSCPVFDITDVDADTLYALCEEFKENLFKLVNKPIPNQSKNNLENIEMIKAMINQYFDLHDDETPKGAMDRLAISQNLLQWANNQLYKNT